MRFADVLCVASCALLCGCSTTGLTPWEGRSPSWNERRSFDMRQKLRTGEPVSGLSAGLRNESAGRVTFFVRNDAEIPLTLYRSFRVDQGQFDADSDLFISVRDAETQMAVPMKKNSWTSGSDHHNSKSYYQMVPFEKIETTINLTKLFNLKPYRKYEVCIEYDHQESGFYKGGRWLEMNAWKGRVRSNTTEVNISTK